MKKYIYDEIAIKAVMNILNSLKVEGINQAQNLVKMAAILSAGEIEESLLIKSQALFENFCEVILWHNSKTASSAGQKESRNRRNGYSFCSRLRRCAFTLP